MSHVIGRGRYGRETYPNARTPSDEPFISHYGTDRTNDNLVEMPAGGEDGYADFIPHDTTGGDPTPVSFDLNGYVGGNPIHCGFTIQTAALEGTAAPKFYIWVNYNNGNGAKVIDMFDTVPLGLGETRTHSADYTIVPPENAVNPTFRVWVVQEASGGSFTIFGGQMNVWAQELDASASNVVTAYPLIDPPGPF